MATGSSATPPQYAANSSRKRTTAEAIGDTPQVLKKKLKEMVEKLSPLHPLVKEAVKEVVSKEGNTGLNKTEVKETVEKAVKEAVTTSGELGHEGVKLKKPADKQKAGAGKLRPKTSVR